MATFIKGEVAIVYIDDGGVWLPIACLTSNSLSSTLGTIETETKCDPGVVISQSGTFNYSLDMEGNYIDTTSVGGDTAKASHDKLFALQQAKTSVTWRLDTGLTDNTAYYGTAVISDLSADFPSGDEFATFSATFQGSGAVVLVDPVTT